MSWTIRSKTEKTSLASTDGVPMQEAGGTTKWFSLTNLATFLGIPGGVANKAAATELTTILTGDCIATAQLSGLHVSDYFVASSCDNSPVGDVAYFHLHKTPWIGDDPAYGALYADTYADNRKWVGYVIGNVWSGWDQITDANGNAVFPVVATTASAANAYIGANGTTILKSTSSAKYKTDIVTLDDSSTLDSLRPVLYKSNPETVPGDDPTKEHYGFIAEELDEIDEKLVQYVDDVPDGVQYDRITVLLVKRIHELEARLAKAGI